MQSTAALSAWAEPAGALAVEIGSGGKVLNIISANETPHAAPDLRNLTAGRAAGRAATEWRRDLMHEQEGCRRMPGRWLVQPVFGQFSASYHGVARAMDSSDDGAPKPGG